MIPADWLDAVSRAWAPAMLDRLAGSTLVFLVVHPLWLSIRRWCAPQLGYALYGLVLLKLALPAFPLEAPVPAEWRTLEAIAPVEWPPFPAEPVGNAQPVGPVPASMGAASSMPAAGIPNVSPAGGMEMPGLLNLLFFAWLAGAAAMAVRLTGSAWWTRNALRDAAPVPRDEFPFDIEAEIRNAGIAFPVPVLQSPSARSPLARGVWRPSVVLPAGFHLRFEPPELRWVLRHELAHIRRRDPLVRWIQALLGIAFYMHPVLWWTHRAMDRLRELACDDAATRETRIPPVVRGEGFLKAVLQANASRRRALDAATMVSSKTLIQERLVRILDETQPRQSRRGLWAASFVALLALATLPWSLVPDGQSRPAPLPAALDDGIEIRVYGPPKPDPEGNLTLIPTKYPEYTEQWLERYEGIYATQLTYKAVEDYFPELPEEEARRIEKDLDYLRDLLERKRTHSFREEEIPYISTLTDDEIRLRIRQNERRLMNEPVDAVHTYSALAMNNKIRVDIERIGDSRNCFYLLYDGNEGYQVQSNGMVTRGVTITHYFTSFMGFARPGTGLEFFLDRNASIISATPELNQIHVQTFTPGRGPRKMLFTLLEDDRFAWRRCEFGNPELPSHRTVCDDFIEIAGLKIPRTVVQQSPALIGGKPVIHDKVRMTLIDAKVNGECEFPEGFFEPPIGPDTVVRTFTR